MRKSEDASEDTGQSSNRMLIWTLEKKKRWDKNSAHNSPKSSSLGGGKPLCHHQLLEQSHAFHNEPWLVPPMFSFLGPFCEPVVLFTETAEVAYLGMPISVAHVATFDNRLLHVHHLLRYSETSVHSVQYLLKEKWRKWSEEKWRRAHKYLGNQELFQKGSVVPSSIVLSTFSHKLSSLLTDLGDVADDVTNNFITEKDISTKEITQTGKAVSKDIKAYCLV